MDPKMTYRLEVKIEGFWNKQNDGRKIYVKGKTIKLVIDSDMFSLCDLMSDLSNQISWGICQTPRVWFHDKNKGKDVGLLNESQMPEMFRIYQEERSILLLVVVCDTDGSSNCSDPTFPCTPSQPAPYIAPSNQSQVESSQGCNTSSQPGPSIALSSQARVSQNSQIAGQPDQFDDPDPDEYVGVNDEYIYLFDGEAVHEEYISPDVDEEHISPNVHEETIIDDVVECERIITYDSENPKIEVGSLFPDVDAFRKALRHFAIKNEFEVCTVKSDKTRFIGKCKNHSCPWRIRASRLQDNKTFMVCMHNLGI
jgi:MuDR family transposase